jgi:hypothetical protein
MTDETIARRGRFTIGLHENKHAVFDAAGAVVDSFDLRPQANARIEILNRIFEEQQQQMERVEHERQSTATDSTTLAWTARRYTAVEWYELLKEGTSSKLPLNKSYAPETPYKFTIKDAYRVADQHRLALTQHTRRLIEKNWEGDLTERLERFDREHAAARVSDPFVLAMLRGVERVPRLRRQPVEKRLNEQSKRPGQTAKGTTANEANAQARHAQILELWHAPEHAGLSAGGRKTLIEERLKCSRWTIDRAIKKSVQAV